MNARLPHIAVLGGGYAGMAAAVTLAQAGVAVTVYEAASHLGGRARRVEYKGVTLDNGLHVLIGACSEVQKLVQLVNRDAARMLLRLPLDWHMVEGFRLRVRPLPAPFHLAVALATARGLGWRARWAAARFIGALRAARFQLTDDVTVSALLAAHRQHESAIRYLWQPLCASALNTPIDAASARVFVNVLRDGLAKTAAQSDLIIARENLTALFPEPAAEYVQAHRGEVRTGHTVSNVVRRDGMFVVTAHGSAQAFTHVVCALAPQRLEAAIGRIVELRPALEKVAQFRYLPIHTIYLQYANRVQMPAPMMGIGAGLAQWVFDREAICGQDGLLAAVISAGGAHARLEQEELARRVDTELRRHFGPLPPLAWHRVIAEKRATFACTAGIERPSARTPLEAFHLAGDYVESDYPATLEGAVRSGISAARAVLRTLG